MNVKVQWDQYQDDEYGSQRYQATVEFSAEHLGPGKTAARNYEDRYPTKISNQIAEDIRQYLEDPIEFVKELLRLNVPLNMLKAILPSGENQCKISWMIL